MKHQGQTTSDQMSMRMTAATGAGTAVFPAGSVRWVSDARGAARRTSVRGRPLEVGQRAAVPST